MTFRRCRFLFIDFFFRLKVTNLSGWQCFFVVSESFSKSRGHNFSTVLGTGRTSGVEEAIGLVDSETASTERSDDVSITALLVSFSTFTTEPPGEILLWTISSETAE